MIKTSRKYGSKSITSNKKYSRRVVRRIPKSISNSGMIMRVEYDTQVTYNMSDAQPSFQPAGNTYINFAAMLAANPAFVSQALNYTRYKISGCSFTATPCYSETSLAAGFPFVGCPVICVQQYPTLTSQSVGDEVNFSDNNLYVKPNDLTQAKYWSYKSNFLIGIGSGVGTWNQTNSVASQQGQFSIRAPDVGSLYVASALVILYAVRGCLYVTLDGKSR
jgi:hypothetical protein